MGEASDVFVVSCESLAEKDDERDVVDEVGERRPVGGVWR